MNWAMSEETFYLADIQYSTKYRALLRVSGKDEKFFDELTCELQNLCQQYRVTRMSLIKSFGRIAVIRAQEIESLMQERLGNKFHWKVVTMGVDYSKQGGFGRFFGVFLSPLPILFIRFYI